MNKMTPEQLEKFIHQNLRSLPPRRAPRTLESRVMAALEQQAAVAWYHKSWSYWPAAVRAAFLVVATGISGAMLTAFYQMFTGVESSTFVAQAGVRFSFLARIYHTAVWVVEFAAPDTFFSGVDSTERREWIEHALAKLPDHQRVPLTLYHFEDMPYEDIAKKTRVSLSKVKTDILRGREALAKILMRSGASHEQFQN